ncbi:MAG: hypothetical protein MJD61_09880 [Proteobacteria bacterium]|nr:hypothetical protein [Pseudomonadota bacterium]
MTQAVIRNDDVPKLRRFMDRIRGVPVRYDLRAYERVVRQIDALDGALRQLDDADLRAQAQRLGRAGSSAEPARVARLFALIRELGRRKLGLRAFGGCGALVAQGSASGSWRGRTPRARRQGEQEAWRSCVAEHGHRSPPQ